MTLWSSSQPPWALSLFFLLIGAYQQSWRGKTFIKLWKMQITAYICKYGCLSFDENINLYCHIKMWITGFKSKFASFLENVVVYHLMNIIINLDWYRFRWTEIDTNAYALALCNQTYAGRFHQKWHCSHILPSSTQWWDCFCLVAKLGLCWQLIQFGKNFTTNFATWPLFLAILHAIPGHRL